MPLTVADLDTLEQYLAGVMNRSVHHAETVGAIVLALLERYCGRRMSIHRSKSGLTMGHLQMSFGCKLPDSDMRWRTTIGKGASNCLRPRPLCKPS